VVSFTTRRANVAQPVEQLIRNQQVRGSIPRVGSNKFNHLAQRSTGHLFLGNRWVTTRQKVERPVPRWVTTTLEVAGSTARCRPGVYAWYFRQIPTNVPTRDCIRWHDLTLLYIGISPSRPTTNGKLPSRQNLRTRIRYHFRGNAAGSTLRLTLGTLLAKELGITLRRVGSGNRRTFAAGEATMSEWMRKNAFVCWLPCEQPWEEEETLIERLLVPLNLAGNQRHPFHAILTTRRREARALADNQPIWRRSGGTHEAGH